MHSDAKYKDYKLPSPELIEFLENQRNSLIYFYIFPNQVEEKVYEEYGKYYSPEMDDFELDALALAAYAKVVSLELYHGVLHRETIEEEEEVKGQMELTRGEIEETNHILFSRSPNDMKKMLKIQQKKGLANLKFMAWETGVNEKKLLDFWLKMTLDVNAYQNIKKESLDFWFKNIKMNMEKVQETKKQHAIGPFPKDYNQNNRRHWALKTLDIDEHSHPNIVMIEKNYKYLTQKYDKEKNVGDKMCEDICEWVYTAYQWLKNNLYLTPTKSVFSFSGLPLGFPLVFRKNKYFVDTSSCYD
jgi:hypothetical protein